ncbi:MAG: nucleotide disphospho-sugar-binding domain-containing protein [Solirubrobacteraceae bacterium]
MQTWQRWRPEIERLGMAFSASPEYHVFPTLDRPLKPYEAVVRAVRETEPLVRAVAPGVVVADILTLAPALAAELADVPWATLIPHVYPVGAPGFPPYSLGARLPRTAAGRALWRGMDRFVEGGLRRGRAELNETRRRLDMPPVQRLHGGQSPDLVLVGTLPELEYPRPWPAHAEVVGPLHFEIDHPEVGLPPGDDPLVLVAPSTAQDPEHRLLRASLDGLADAPVRVLATYNRRLPSRPLRVPDNARLVSWLSYAKTMPRADLVITHGGHGTVVRALSCGTVPVVVPAAGDMNENAARVAWAGLGVRLPRRFATPRAVRLAVAAALSDPMLRSRVQAVARTPAATGGASRAADVLEGFAA